MVSDEPMQILAAVRVRRAGAARGAVGVGTGAGWGVGRLVGVRREGAETARPRPPSRGTQGWNEVFSGGNPTDRRNLGVSG